MSLPDVGRSGGEYAAPPVCPRHPDRVSYVRCQRCDRPVCPQCQRPAAVGVQCVDCVNAAAKATPTQRTVLGGRARGGRPLVTIAVTGACVAVYLASRVFPAVVTTLIFAPVIGASQPYRFLTTAFLHAGFLHLALNMYALWIVGGFLEQMLGRSRFLALYLLSAVGGSVAVLLLSDPGAVTWVTPVVGASGAVFGAFGAILMVLRRTGRDASQILALIVINLVIGLFVARVSWQAHGGGLLVGLALGALYAYAPRASRRWTSVAGTVGMAAVLALAAFVKYSA